MRWLGLVILLAASSAAAQTQQPQIDSHYAVAPLRSYLDRAMTEQIMLAAEVAQLRDQLAAATKRAEDAEAKLPKSELPKAKP